MILTGELPRPDYALIVDTGRERSAVWDYHHHFVEPALAKIGITIHRVKKTEWATVDIYAGNGDLLLPAYTNESGEIGKLPTFCSNEWKKRVSERFLRSLGVPTNEQRKWIGFSLEEAQRVIKMRQGADFRAGLIRFPLIEDVPLRRHQAIQRVLDYGWPTPPRSACWMCPNASDDEWRELKEQYPNDFHQAVMLEREVRLKDQHAFFHSSCGPLDEVDFCLPPQMQLFQPRPCDRGMCFT